MHHKQSIDWYIVQNQETYSNVSSKTTCTYIKGYHSMEVLYIDYTSMITLSHTCSIQAINYHTIDKYGLILRQVNIS